MGVQTVYVTACTATVC